MKIIRCPKGGRVPEGFCRQSCLNYSRAGDAARRTVFRRLVKLFADDGKSWLDIYKDEIVPLRNDAWCDR